MPDLTVFISYRRADSSADAGRLYDALRRRFGRENLFMDVDSLRPGEDWVDAVEGAVTRCDVLLAIIGPDWVGAADGEGNRRLNKELDRVRLEIEAALRNSKPVIPVLVEGASMPSSEDLPDTLRPLLRRHAIRVSHSTFESDLGALVRALRIIDRATHGRRTTHAADAADNGPLVVTPAPEPALPGPPPTTQTAAPSTSPSVPITPTPAPPPPVAAPPMYVAPQPGPPQPMPQPTYTPPPVVPAYPYAQPVYGYNPPETRKGPSGVLVGVIALVLVLIVGVGAMYALHIGPFATAVASPTPIPTVVPTAVVETPTPTIPPTASAVPPTATVPSTASAPPVTPSTAPGALDHLWAVVPVTVRDSCSEDNSLATPRLYCFIAAQTLSFWYESFDTPTALDEEYQSWLTFRSIDQDVANCFDEPMPLPCEGPYKVGGIDPAGRIAAVVDADNGWLYWTHEQALVFGTGLVTLGGGQTFDDLFSYWKSDASVLNFTPPPSP